MSTQASLLITLITLFCINYTSGETCGIHFCSDKQSCIRTPVGPICLADGGAGKARKAERDGHDNGSGDTSTTVSPTEKPEESIDGLSKGGLLLMAFGAVAAVVVILAICFCYCCCCRKKRKVPDPIPVPRPAPRRHSPPPRAYTRTPSAPASQPPTPAPQPIIYVNVVANKNAIRRDDNGQRNYGNWTGKPMSPAEMEYNPYPNM